MQSGSCSAPTMSVPPFGTATEDEDPELVLVLLSLLHAAAARPNTINRARSAKPRRCRLTKDLLGLSSGRGDTTGTRGPASRLPPLVGNPEKCPHHRVGI